MTPLRIIFAGSGEFGLATLDALMSLGHDVVQVVSQPDRPAGRGKQVTPTPIAQRALAAGLPLLRTDAINREPLPDADVMVVIAFGQKIAEAIADRPRLASVNLHASRLPRYRGAAPINWAILRGETVTGNSVIRLAPRMDAGAVLAESEIVIGEMETAGELHDRLATDGAMIVPRVLADLAEGNARETPQDEEQATLAPKLSREDARLDWTDAADALARRVRGLYPWPGCRVKVCDAEGADVGRIRLVRARAVDGHDEGPRWFPGEITASGLVHTGRGSLEVVDVQPDGKRAMSLADYRRGHRWHAGLGLESVV